MKVDVVRQAMVEAVENVRRKTACARHFFPRLNTERLSTRYACEICSGTMQIHEIGIYIAGYVAAGGRAQDIAPDWTGS